MIACMGSPGGCQVVEAPPNPVPVGTSGLLDVCSYVAGGPGQFEIASDTI